MRGCRISATSSVWVVTVCLWHSVYECSQNFCYTWWMSGCRISATPSVVYEWLQNFCDTHCMRGCRLQVVFVTLSKSSTNWLEGRKDNKEIPSLNVTLKLYFFFSSLDPKNSHPTVEPIKTKHCISVALEEKVGNDSKNLTINTDGL